MQRRSRSCAGRVVIRSTTDSFHRLRAERLARGTTSADGYYLDSHVATDAVLVSDSLFLHRPEFAQAWDVSVYLVVVMTHGTSATISMVADRYAEAFARAGVSALLYDHRNLGSSDGEPRQEINPWVQSRGYREAIDFASALEDHDSDRIGIWGTCTRRARCSWSPLVTQESEWLWRNALSSVRPTRGCADAGSIRGNTSHDTCRAERSLKVGARVNIEHLGAIRLKSSWLEVVAWLARFRFRRRSEDPRRSAGFRQSVVGGRWSVRLRRVEVS